jgi:hypothetical protein
MSGFKKQIETELFKRTGVIVEIQENLDNILTNEDAEVYIKTFIRVYRRDLFFKSEDEIENIDEGFKHPEINKDIFPKPDKE